MTLAQIAFAKVTKVDEATRTVYGRAVQEVPDHAKEIFDYTASKCHFVEWSAGFEKVTDGKSLGNVRAMHGDVAAGKVVEIVFQDDERAIDIAAKIVDDNEWKKVQEGVYTGFSIGGKYVKKWPDDQNPDLIRYEATPSEISIVDLPCIPTATFLYSKSDGSTEMRKFIKGASHADMADSHKDKAAAHREKAKDAKGDKKKAHNAAADAHDDAADAHGKFADDKGDKDDAKDKSDKANGLSGKANEMDEDDAGEKAAQATLTKMIEGGTKASELLALIEAQNQAAKAAGSAGAKHEVRRLLVVGGLTNGAVEGLVKQHLQEAEHAGTPAELVARLDKFAQPVPEFNAEVLAKLSGNVSDEAATALAGQYLPAADMKAATDAKETGIDLLARLHKMAAPAADPLQKAASAPRHGPKVTVHGVEYASPYGTTGPQAEYLAKAANMMPEVAAKRHAMVSGYIVASDMVAKVAERADADPKEGKDKYGDVKFADAKNKKYPIDTAAHIKAAWNYINKPKNAGKYSADDVKSIKAKIVAAWKDKIDADGPPSAEKAIRGDGLAKAMATVIKPDGSMDTRWFSTGLMAVAGFAYTVQSLWDAAECCALEQQYEGDTESQLPARLEALAIEAGEILCEMVEEETQEEADMKAAKAELIGNLRKAFVGDKPSKMIDQLLAKAGARHSKEDAGRLQKIHDHSVDMGAKCSGMDSSKTIAAGSVRKVLGLAEDAPVEVVEKSIAEAARKAAVYDAMPAPAVGVLKSMEKAVDTQPGSGEAKISEEDKELLDKAEKGDPLAQVKVIQRFGRTQAPPPPSWHRR